MKKTELSVMETLADRLGDNVLHKFMKEFEIMDDKREMYTCDSFSHAFFPFEEVKTNLASSFVEGLLMENEWKVNSLAESKLSFVFTEYDFINAQAEELVRTYEGSVCCHDKSATLVNMYIRYLGTGELPDVTKGEKEFWKPALGTAQEWMDFIDSTLQLHQGRTEAYFKAYRVLADQYELWVKEKRLANEQLLVNSPYFTGKVIVDGNMEYSFEAEGGIKGTVILKSNQECLYRYSEPAMEGLKPMEWHRYPKQEWFTELLNRVK